MPQNPEPDILSRLDSLEALLDAQTKSIDEGLARLSDKDDPYVIRRKLAILLEAQRYDEAAAAIGNTPPHREWVEKAIFALVQVGGAERAKELLNWAAGQGDLALRDRCILLFAQACYLKAFNRHSKEARIIPGSLSDDERTGTLEALAVLAPILHVIEGHGRVLNALEEHAVSLALQSQYYLGNRAEVEKLATWLETRSPIPLLLATFVQSGIIDAPASMPQRLREEHPSSFDASMLAYLIEGTRLGRRQEAFDAASTCDTEQLSELQRRKLFEVLHRLAQELDQSALHRLEGLIPRLIGQDLATFKFFMAERYLTSERPEVARTILEETRDENDPRWLQLWGYLKYKTGDSDEALRRFIEASKHMPEPDLFRQIAQVAGARNRDDIVVDVLEKVLAIEPGDHHSRHNLAVALARTSRYGEAADQFRTLSESRPEDPIYPLNRAAALALSNRLEESLSVYEALCRRPEPPLAAALGRAEVLRSLNRPREAFEVLESCRERFWDEHQFLLTFMSIGFAAGRDKDASLALLHVQELQTKEKAPADALRAVPIEELKQSFLERLKQHEEIYEKVLEGQFPWILAEDARGRVPYFAWAFKTQELRWLSADRQARAEFAIYATNGYAVIDDGSGSKELVRFECPKRGSTVAMDVTSLITLHELGLLESAGEYFEKILIPPVYLETVLYERSRLTPHQLSQKEAFERLKEALDAGRLSVADAEASPSESAPALIDEHGIDCTESGHCYRLVDIIEPMYRCGWLTAEANQRAREVATRPSGVDDSHPQLRLFRTTRFALSSLVTLHSVNQLEVVLGAYRGVISAAAKQEILQSVREFQILEQVRHKHEKLWDHVRCHPRFEIVSYETLRHLQAVPNGEGATAAYAISASLLAEQQKLPVLVDDRGIQVIAQSERATDGLVACSTDRLIERLGEEGLLSIGRVADAVLQLMRWRYRFLIPSPEILKNLLDRHIGNPPGQLLREVALYAHSCMSDPGLLGGFEPTHPPTSIGARIHQGWNLAISQFVMLVWEDENWNEEAARHVTLWAMRELLPSDPTTLPEKARGMLMRLTPRLVLSNALIRSSMLHSRQRANMALLSIARALGVKEDQYLKIVTDVIHEA